MNNKAIFLTAIFGMGLLVFAGCAPSEIAAPWQGDSADLLQDSQAITVTPEGENSINISIQPKEGSEACEGTFEMYNSRGGIPVYAGAVKSYKGSFKEVTTKECEKAIGGKGGIERFIDIRDPSLFGSTMLFLCNTASSDTICLPTNTFKIEGGE